MKKVFKNLSEKEIEQYAVTVAYPAITPFVIKKGNKVDSNISGNYFPLPILSKMFDSVDKILNSKNVKETHILLINDLGLQWVHKLNKEFGLTKFYMLCVDTANVNKEYIKALILDTCENIFDMGDIEVIPVYLHELGDILKMINKDKFDLAIGNPPYEIGNAVITETMKHCKEAVVLMPLSRYKKDGLFKQIKNITIIPMGEANFEDAATTPHICELKSNYNNNFSYEEIQLYSYDQKWIKYYRENLKREVSWVRTSYPKTEDIYRMNREKCTFMLTIRTGVDGVHKTKDCTDYKWNLENTFTLGQRGSSKSDKSIPMYTDGVYMGEFATFKTTEERENIIDFWYSSKIMSSIVRGLNKQTFPNVDLFLPKVDWTRSWTDEEILKDYGYTDEEIKEILK